MEVAEQQRLSHHRLLEKLGEGGMGSVRKAHDTKLDRWEPRFQALLRKTGLAPPG